MTAACAKFPPNAARESTRLIFTMTVAGEIRDNYIYMVALRPSPNVNPNPADGPLAVIQRPWGNGLVAGNASHYVLYDVTQAAAPYTIYKFQLIDPVNYVGDLSNIGSQIGIPISFSDVPPGSKTIQFEILLSYLEPNPSTEATLQTLQVNFLTMNRRPTGDDPGTKVWDALGDNNLPSEINTYLNLPLNHSDTYNNTNHPVIGIQEVEGDTPDPDLDIVNWQVEIIRP